MLKSYQSNKRTKYYLPSNVLDNVWISWLKSDDNPIKGYKRHLEHGYTHFATNASSKFSDWLITQGATVKRREREYIIEFDDKETAMFFILRFS